MVIVQMKTLVKMSLMLLNGTMENYPMFFYDTTELDGYENINTLYLCMAYIQEILSVYFIV